MNRRTTATALNWPHGAATSRPVHLLAAGWLAAVLAAPDAVGQEPEPAGPQPGPAVTAQQYFRGTEAEPITPYSVTRAESGPRLTLESEAVFFDRLERQATIEAARESVRKTRSKLAAARRRLNLPELATLEEQLVPKMSRALDFLDLASRSLNSSLTALANYQERSTPLAAAIAAGQRDPIPLYSRIQRGIKVAEHAVRTANLSFQASLQLVKQTQQQLAALHRSLAPDDPRRPAMGRSLAQAAAAAQALEQLMAGANATLELLDQIQRDHFPICQLPAEPCGRITRQWLDQAVAALGLLESCRGQLQDSRPVLDRLAQSVVAAREYAERADEPLYPAHRQARQAQAAADALLQQTEQLLDEAERDLAADCGEEQVVCESCPDYVRRLRRVMDPAEACARAGRKLDQAQNVLQQAGQLVRQMEQSLRGAPPAKEPRAAKRRAQALDELTGAYAVRGASEELAAAVHYLQQFRNQRFDFYQAGGYRTEPTAVPPRAFPPMIAFYAARQTWYYAGYFDDPALERDGHSFGLVQPAVSYVKFLVDLAMVPYNVVAEPPHQPQYTLGYNRPGDPVPHIIYLPRWNPWAATFEGAVWALGLTLLP